MTQIEYALQNHKSTLFKAKHSRKVFWLFSYNSGRFVITVGYSGLIIGRCLLTLSARFLQFLSKKNSQKNWRNCHEKFKCFSQTFNSNDYF